MDAAGEVVHQHRPGDVLLQPIAFGIDRLLLERPVRADLRTGVRLADEDVNERNLAAPFGVQL
jgi:hypothetical protein